MSEDKWEIPPNVSMGDLTRNFSTASLENLMNMYNSNKGVRRIDSEDQFKKWLDKIPSMTNLAGAANGQSLQQANPEQVSQQMALFQQQNFLAPSSSPLSSQLPESGGLNVQGIPRVASLDLLRQMMNSPYPVGAMKGSNLVKEEPRDQSNGSESLHLPTEPVPVVPMPSLDMRMPNQSLMHRSGSEDHMPSTAEPSTSYVVNETQPEIISRGRSSKDKSKAEIRREKRMLSNRESARRSRKRKQEHLGALEEQIANLEADKDQLAVRNEKLERQLASANEQNASLKHEVEALRQKLGIQGPDLNHKRPRGV